ncbi:hypothetical protein [Prevotella sp.]|uniref:hypothetical protein n=1 Tax=Prevotella sp. TaxID=59823 RepID=UPI003078A19F
MKKEYIEPRISVVTCSSEHNILSGSTGTKNLNGGQTIGPGTSTGQEEVGSKFNSGMSWDEEE